MDTTPVERCPQGISSLLGMPLVLLLLYHSKSLLGKAGKCPGQLEMCIYLVDMTWDGWRLLRRTILWGRGYLSFRQLVY